MASCIDEIRSHVFKVIHDFADCDVEVSAFGACLPPGVASIAHDPQYWRGLVRSMVGVYSLYNPVNQFTYIW